MWAIGTTTQNEEGEQDGRRALDEEHPLPAMQAKKAIHKSEDGAGDRSADDGRAGRRNDVARDRTRAIFFGEPIGDIEGGRGKEPGLRQTQHETKHVETRRVADES